MLDNLNTATIIIPRRDNDGSDNAPVIERTVRTLCETHGGATAWDARGFWVSPVGKLFQDDVTIIQAAMIRSDDNREALRALALDVLADTDQEAVYVSYAGGEVEIIDKE